MKYTLIASAALGGILLFLLAAASADTSLFAGHYSILLVLNAVIALALIGLVGWQLWTLRQALKARKFGAQLTLRFLLIFALMAALPGALVYTVSVQFLAKSIESWFNVRVDAALDVGLDLGRSVLDNMLGDVRRNARNMASELADLPLQRQIDELNHVREQANINEASIISGNGAILSTASSTLTKLIPDPLPADVLRRLRQDREYAAIEPVGERGLQSRVIIPLPTAGWSQELHWLQLLQPVPPNVAQSVETVQAAQRDYKELSLLRGGLKRIYILTLTLALLLSLFSAIALAFILSRRLSQPLAVLAESTHAVARGDFTRRAKVTSRDELGVLTKSFNVMTEQLGAARAQAERDRDQIESAKAYLENILSNLSTGVLTFDETFRLQIVNAGARSILGEALEADRALAATPALQDLDTLIREAFAEAKEGQWQLQLERPEFAQTLLLRGSTLPLNIGYVVVFDEVSQLIAAQRATAWAEVARRLAHEIKNPLTPIQLSAERLQSKLSDKLDAADAQTLVRATETIINQVAAMKAMVDEFRDYSRLPAPTMTPLDLNALVSEVLGLYENWRSRISLKLESGLPPVRGDATQLRQVIHNLLQNAQDALSSHAAPHIEVRTERAGDSVRLCVRDNGGGFSESIMKRAFEPYVTTKPKGTGLGLAIVKKIVDEHHGTVMLENKAGAAVTIALPLAA